MSLIPEPSDSLAVLAAGLDIGTSGCRAVVIDAHRRPVAWGRCRWPQGDMPTSPELWHQTALAALAQACTPCSGRIDYLTIDATSPSVLLSTLEGTPLTRALLYNEPAVQRFSEPLAHLAPPASAAYGVNSGLARALQLASQAAPGQGFLIHSQADWLAASLCATFGWSDENNALKLGYDPVTRSWPDWLKQLNLPSVALPRVYPLGTPIATITATTAEQTGLSPTCRIVAGTTDSIAGFLAAGAEQPGEAVTSLGTTLALKLISPTALFSTAHGVYSHRFEDCFLAGGASNCGAGILGRYFTAEQIEELSTHLDPDQDTGLGYYPLPSPGERFPYAEPGLQPLIAPRPESDAEFLQGLMEGLAAVEAQGYQRLEELGAPRLSRVISVGGGAPNPAWLRIRERYLGVPVSVAEQTEAAYGAALIAHRCMQ